MTCDFCGCEPASPDSMMPVREVVTVDNTTMIEGNRVVLSSKQELGAEHTACEDCYPEVSEPERAWRLENECPQCWAHPCECPS